MCMTFEVYITLDENKEHFSRSVEKKSPYLSNKEEGEEVAVKKTPIPISSEVLCYRHEFCCFIEGQTDVV